MCEGKTIVSVGWSPGRSDRHSYSCRSSRRGRDLLSASPILQSEQFGSVPIQPRGHHDRVAKWSRLISADTFEDRLIERSTICCTTH